MARREARNLNTVPGAYAYLRELDESGELELEDEDGKRCKPIDLPTEDILAVAAAHFMNAVDDDHSKEFH